MINLAAMDEDELNDRLFLLRDNLSKAYSVNANKQIIDQFNNMIAEIENEKSERRFKERYVEPTVINSDQTTEVKPTLKKFNRGNIKKINIKNINE